VKLCLGCNATKALSEYIQISGRPGAYFPRCRACRNEAERKRYGSTPEIRGAEIERAKRNQRLRQARAADTARASWPSADDILLALSNITGLDRSVVAGEDRGSAAVDARTVAVFLLRTEARLSALDVSRLLGMSIRSVRSQTTFDVRSAVSSSSRTSVAS